MNPSRHPAEHPLRVGSGLHKRSNNTMKLPRILGFFLALVFWGAAAIAADAALPPLKLGIMPFNSAVALVKTHQPLTRYLESRLGRKVVIFTAPDYFVYVNQLLDGQFDLAIAGPHFGVMAHERGAVLLYRYKADLQPLFIVREDSPIKDISGLRGGRIALSSPLSMSSIGGAKWLQDQGFQLDQDYRIVVRATHGAAIASVAAGDVDAALTTYTPLNQVPADVRAKVRTLPVDIHIPHLMTIANPRLGQRLINDIRAALRDFGATPEGAAFFRDTGYLGYTEVTPADIKALRPFLELSLQVMRAGS